MYSLEVGEHTYQFSEQIDQELAAFRPKQRAYLIIKSCTKVPEFKPSLGHFKDRNLRGFKILNAHGLEQDGEWFFADKGEGDFYRVQDWVSHHDGTALALMVMVCNPGFEQPLNVRHSLLIYPQGDINLINAQLYPEKLIVQQPTLA